MYTVSSPHRKQPGLPKHVIEYRDTGRRGAGETGRSFDAIKGFRQVLRTHQAWTHETPRTHVHVHTHTCTHAHAPRLDQLGRATRGNLSRTTQTRLVVIEPASEGKGVGGEREGIEERWGRRKKGEREG